MAMVVFYNMKHKTTTIAHSFMTSVVRFIVNLFMMFSDYFVALSQFIPVAILVPLQIKC